MDPKGSTVIAGFMDGVVRVLNVSQLSEDAPHRRHKNDCDLLLEQAFKPHNGSVTCMAIDTKGEILATGVSVFVTSNKILHKHGYSGQYILRLLDICPL